MYQLVSMKKISCLRRRLAIEADSAITTALTRLLEKETERSAIAIQKEIDKRDASRLQKISDMSNIDQVIGERTEKMSRAMVPVA